jgi:hypothetical protein
VAQFDPESENQPESNSAGHPRIRQRSYGIGTRKKACPAPKKPQSTYLVGWGSRSLSTGSNERAGGGAGAAADLQRLGRPGCFRLSFFFDD